MRLQDKVAIVTGGGSGIGTAYTRRFLAEGAKVMIADIGEEQGTRTAAELASEAGNKDRVAFVKTDIADPESAQAAVDATIERFGTVDILVNNAGIGRAISPAEITEADWHQTIRINLTSVFLVTQRALPNMRAKKWGRIINLSSVAAQYSGIVGPYWPPERRIVEGRYRTIEFPFTEIAAPEFAIEQEVTLNDVAGYIRTWSATRAFIKQRQQDPVDELITELARVWSVGTGPGGARVARWPIAMRVGRV